MKLQRTHRLRALTAGTLAVCGALALTACGSDDNAGPGGGPTAAAGHVSCDGTGNLLASGSSAQKNAMDVWVKNYQSACSTTHVNYKPTGSGAGIQEFLQGSTAFAGSDSALAPDEIRQSQKVCKGGGQGVDLPMVGGPIAVGYHLPGVDNLVLNADALARIFNGAVTRWNDPAIRKLNPGAKLPDLKIQAFHRSDDSGTTDNFTKYLHAAAPASWPAQPAKQWAGKGGQSADGSAGIATNVKQNEGAIGYFELSYATGNDIPTVQLNTGAADPVAATTAGASKAIAEAEVVGKGKDLALQLNYTTKAEGAYPMVLVTYEIVCDKGNDKQTLAATKSFLHYAASDAGQQALAGIDYAAMPEEIIAKVRDTIDGLS